MSETNSTVPKRPASSRNPASSEDSANPSIPLHKNPWIWAFLIGIVVVTLTRPLLRRIPEPPPVLGRLPEFALVDAGDERFGPADLEGGVWVVAFFSTRDDATCGGLIRSMAGLGRRFDEAGVPAVRLLGICAEDPPADPEALRAFGEARSLAPPRWVLTGGSPEEIARLTEALVEATGGPVADPPRGNSLRPCRLFLVDGSAGIRGAYRDDTQGLDEVFHRAQHAARAMGP